MCPRVQKTKEPLMPSRLLHKTAADAARDRVFWMGATALVLSQLLAFWMLCSHQVRKAEVRHASLQVESIAIADCLRHVPNATLISCAERVAPLEHGMQPVPAVGQTRAMGAAAANATVPINYISR
jgi:hypothetical protein